MIASSSKFSHSMTAMSLSVVQALGLMSSLSNLKRGGWLERTGLKLQDAIQIDSGSNRLCRRICGQCPEISRQQARGFRSHCICNGVRELWEQLLQFCCSLTHPRRLCSTSKDLHNGNRHHVAYTLQAWSV